MLLAKFNRLESFLIALWFLITIGAGLYGLSVYATPVTAVEDAYPYWSEQTFTDAVAHGTIPFTTHEQPHENPAAFILHLSPTIVDLYQVEMVMRTKPLYTMAYTMEYVPGLRYGTVFSLVEDDDYPIDLRIYLDDVDISAALGGPWNATDRKRETVVSADLTPFIDEMRDYSVIVTSGDSNVTMWGLGAPMSADNPQAMTSAGIIEMTFRIAGMRQLPE